MSDWQAPYFHNKRAYDALGRLKWYRAAAGTLISASQVVGGLAASTYLGTQLGNEIVRRAERSEFERPRKMTRTGGQITQEYGSKPMDCDAGMGATSNPKDRQYVSIVRSQRNRFGKRKRFTKAVIKHMLMRDKFVVRSRFHTFQDNGYQTGVGGVQVTFKEPNLNDKCGTFPFMIYDVSSLAGAAYGTTGLVLPVRQYQLAFSTTSIANKEYKTFGWLPMTRMNRSASDMLDQTNGGFGGRAVAVPVETNGYHPNQRPFQIGTGNITYMPYASGFTHNWSNIEMVLYPQSSIPIKWHVALINFPKRLLKGDSGECVTAGPPLEHYTQGGVQASLLSTTAYDARRSSNSDATDNLDLRWQKFFSGKLFNPINRDGSATGFDKSIGNGLPFNIIEHESFMQPARDHPDFGGTAQRLIKKLFYRREWEFAPVKGREAVKQGDAIANYQTVQTNSNASASGSISSPYSNPHEITYLAVWAEHFKTTTNDRTLAEEAVAFNLGGPDLPSFDLVVNMKHTLSSWNIAKSEAVDPDNPK